jgi:hypothetical protein
MKNLLKTLAIIISVSMLAACSLPSWLTYTNATYQFQLKYPSSGSLVNDTPNAARIQLPIQSGTNLVESYLDIAARTAEIPCLSPYGDAYAPPPGTLVTGTKTINVIYWVIEKASEGAMGSIYEWIAYSTATEWYCVSLTFVLHSHHPDAYPTPVPAYNKDVEEALFLSIVDTFTWLNPDLPAPVITDTPTPVITDTPTPVITDTPTPAAFYFIPKFNAYCRSDPNMGSHSISLAMRDQSYPIDGRNIENTWLYLMITPQVGCWVPLEDGTPSADTAPVRVLATIPTPTFTPVPFDCGQFKDPQSCSQHLECTWNRQVIPGVCQNQ